MLRISTTLLDSFHKFELIDSSDLEKKQKQEIELIESIKGIFKPNKYMQIGSALHSIIENHKESLVCDDGGYEYYSKNDIRFTAESINQIINHVYNNIDLDYKLTEIKTVKLYDINNELIELVAKADMLYANTVYEHKTAYSLWNKQGYRNFETEYYSSLQWQSYLELFEMDYCQYNIFVLKQSPEIELQEIKSFVFSKNDIRPELLETKLFNFTNYLKNNNLYEYLIKKEK